MIKFLLHELPTPSGQCDLVKNIEPPHKAEQAHRAGPQGRQGISNEEVRNFYCKNLTPPVQRSLPAPEGQNVGNSR